MIFVRIISTCFFSSYLIKSKIGLKPDRSFVSPIVHPISNDQIFAELEATREGVKPVIYT